MKHNPSLRHGLTEESNPNAILLRITIYSISYSQFCYDKPELNTTACHFNESKVLFSETRKSIKLVIPVNIWISFIQTHLHYSKCLVTPFYGKDLHGS